MMPEAIYFACALTSALCAALLLRSGWQARSRLALSSGVCFVGFALHNALLVADLVLFPETDLSLLRTSVALVAMVSLLYGCVWESR
jgi:hypothetical protein